jgi:hypothetical protein
MPVEPAPPPSQVFAETEDKIRRTSTLWLVAGVLFPVASIATTWIQLDTAGAYDWGAGIAAILNLIGIPIAVLVSPFMILVGIHLRMLKSWSRDGATIGAVMMVIVLLVEAAVMLLAALVSGGELRTIFSFPAPLIFLICAPYSLRVLPSAAAKSVFAAKAEARAVNVVRTQMPGQ